jgi:hypothetical protein
VVFEEVGGRTTAVVPSVQRKVTRVTVRSTVGAATSAGSGSDNGVKVAVRKIASMKRKRSDGVSGSGEVVVEEEVAAEVDVEKVPVVRRKGVRKSVVKKVVRTSSAVRKTTGTAQTTAATDSEPVRKRARRSAGLVDTSATEAASEVGGAGYASRLRSPRGM